MVATSQRKKVSTPRSIFFFGPQLFQLFTINYAKKKQQAHTHTHTQTEQKKKKKKKEKKQKKQKKRN